MSIIKVSGQIEARSHEKSITDAVYNCLPFNGHRFAIAM